MYLYLCSVGMTHLRQVEGLQLNAVLLGLLQGLLDPRDLIVRQQLRIIRCRAGKFSIH
jgi:hypothetical protein